MEHFPKAIKGFFQHINIFQKTKPLKRLGTLNNYSAIGFDVDHTLVRYQAKEIFPHLCSSLEKVLINNRGYPKSIQRFGPFERNYFMNGLVIDFKTGNILKLGENKQVLRAYFGYERLSMERIQQIYGHSPVYDVFDENSPFNVHYFCCLSFFECYFPLVFAKMVECKKNGKNFLDESQVQEILEDGMYAVKANYSHYNDDKYHSILGFGNYYSPVMKNMDQFVFKNRKMFDALRHLKERGKILFLVSDSHHEYVEALMDYAYGKDWLDVFDYALLNARKPNFFYPDGPHFREIDLTKANRMGPMTDILEMNKMYTLGNASLLEKNIEERIGKNHGRILYVGDHYSFDILAAKSRDNWDSVCIMEELGDLDLGDDYDGRVWGHPQYEETEKGEIPTFWYSKMMEKADKCVPLVECDEMLDFYYQHEPEIKSSSTNLPEFGVQ